MTDHDVAEVQQAEKLLNDLRQALLRLHKTLLDWERGGYERIHGRQSSNDLLNALLNTAAGATWLAEHGAVTARRAPASVAGARPARSAATRSMSWTTRTSARCAAR